MRDVIVICGMFTALGFVALLNSPRGARAQQSPAPVFETPLPGTTVTVSLTKEARVPAHGGELVEVTGSLVRFSESWVAIQSPETGSRIWIPTQQVSHVSIEAGARPLQKPQ